MAAKFFNYEVLKMEKKAVMIAVLAVIAIAVIAGIVMTNNTAATTTGASAPTNSQIVVDCTKAPDKPLQISVYGKINPEYDVWMKEWGTCNDPRNVKSIGETL